MGGLRFRFYIGEEPGRRHSVLTKRSCKDWRKQLFLDAQGEATGQTLPPDQRGKCRESQLSPAEARATGGTPGPSLTSCCRISKDKSKS